MQLQKNKYFYYYDLIQQLNNSINNDKNITQENKHISRRNLISVKKVIEKSFNLL